MEDPYLRGIFDGRTHPFDPRLKVHPQAPEKRVYKDAAPGVMDALARQLAGLTSLSPTEQNVGENRAYLDNIYDDTVSTYAPVPITQILADFAKNKYQQHGQDTGSVFLNSLLGYIPNSSMTPGEGGTPLPPTTNNPVNGGGGTSGAPVGQLQQMVINRMNGSDGGKFDRQGYGGLGMSGYDSPNAGGGNGGGGDK